MGSPSDKVVTRPSGAWHPTSKLPVTRPEFRGPGNSCDSLVLQRPARVWPALEVQPAYFPESAPTRRNPPSHVTPFGNAALREKIVPCCMQMGVYFKSSEGKKGRPHKKEE